MPKPSGDNIRTYRYEGETYHVPEQYVDQFLKVTPDAELVTPFESQLETVNQLGAGDKTAKPVDLAPSTLDEAVDQDEDSLANVIANLTVRNGQITQKTPKDNLLQPSKSKEDRDKEFEEKQPPESGVEKVINDGASIVGSIGPSIVHGAIKGIQGVANAVVNYGGGMRFTPGMGVASVRPYKDREERKEQAQAVAEISGKVDQAADKVDQFVNPDYNISKKRMQRMGDVGRFVGNSVMGMSEFLPAMVAAPATGGTSLFFSGYQSGLDEAKEAGIDPETAQAFASVSGGLFSAFNAIPIGRALNKSIVNKVVRNLAANSLKKALVESGEKKLSYAVMNTALTDAKKSLADVIKTQGIKGVKNLAEATGFTLADVLSREGLKAGINKATGEDKFHIATSDEFGEQMVSGIAAQVFMQGMFGAFSPKTQNYIKERIANAKSPEDIAEIHNSIDGMTRRGKIDVDQAEDLHNSVNAYTEIKRTLPEKLGPDKQAQIFDVIKERNQMQMHQAELHQELGKIQQAEDPALQQLDQRVMEDAITMTDAAIEAKNDEIREIATGKKYQYSEKDGVPVKKLGEDGPEETTLPDVYELRTQEPIKEESVETKEPEQPKEETPTEAEPEKTTKPAETVADEKASVKAEAEPAEPTPTFEETEGSRVTYNGTEGVLKKDGQTYVVENDNTIREIGNVDELKGRPIGERGVEERGVEERGVEERGQVEVRDDNTVHVRGKDYQNNYSDPLAAITHGEDGTVKSVTLETPEGNKRTFRGESADEIAYQLTLKELEKRNENEKFEEYINRPENRKELDDAEAESASEKSTDKGDAKVSKTEPGEISANPRENPNVKAAQSKLSLPQLVNEIVNEKNEARVKDLNEELQRRKEENPDIDVDEAMRLAQDTKTSTEGGGKKGVIYETKNGKYSVVSDGTDTRVLDSRTGKPLSEKASRKYVEEAADNTDFTKGKRTEEADDMPEFTSEEEADRYVVENSENPAEVATVFARQEPEAQTLSTKEQAIADYGIGYVTNRSFNRFGDPNHKNRTIGLAYLRSKERGGKSMDVIAKEISDQTGIHVTEEDLYNFMTRFPGGVRQAFSTREGPIAQAAREKFYELTGLPLTDKTAEIAVNQEFSKLPERTRKELNKSNGNEQTAETGKGTGETQAGADGNGKEGQNNRPLLQGEKERASAEELGDTPFHAGGGVSLEFPPIKRRRLKKIAKAIEKVFSKVKGFKGVHVVSGKDLDRIVAEAKEGRYNFIGERGAWLRVHNGLVQARAWDEAGINPEVIFKKTGWYKDANDGQWRYELPNENVEFLPADKDNPLHGKKIYTATLGEVLDYPELYKAFPEFKDITVESEDLPNNIGGKYDPTTKTLTINGNHEARRQESGLRHEVQHLIQQKEGFAGGGHPVEGKRRVLREIQKMDRERRALERRANAPNTEARVSGIIKEQIKMLDDRIAQMKSNTDAYAHYFYQAYAGEIEARNVQERAKHEEVRKSGSPNKTAQKYPQGDITVDRYLRRSDGTIYGVVHDGNIYLNGDKLNSHTPLHEASHEFTSWAKENAPDVYRAGLDLMDGSDYLSRVKKEKFYQRQAKQLKDRGATDAQIEDFYRGEALARSVGDAGSRFEGSLRARFREWLNQFWEGVKYAFGKGSKRLEDMTADQVSNMSIAEFSDAMASRIRSGKPLKESRSPEQEVRFHAERKKTADDNLSKAKDSLAKLGDLVSDDVKKAILRKYEKQTEKLDTDIAEAIDRVPEGPKAANMPKAEAEHYSEVAGSLPLEGTDTRIPAEPILGGKPRLMNDAIKDLTDGLNLKLRKVKPSRRTAGGAYRPGDAGVISRNTRNLKTIAHEVGHFLDDKFGLLKDVLSGKERDLLAELQEFSKYEHASKPPKGLSKTKQAKYKAGEGFAEWMRNYIAAPKETIRRAPEIYRRYRDLVPEDVRAVIDKFSEEYRVFEGASGRDQTLASIRMDPKQAKSPLLRRAFGEKDKFSVSWVDNIAANWLDPLQVFNKAVKYLQGMRGIEELLPEDHPYMLARLFAAEDRKFEEFLEKGIRDGKGEYVLNEDGERINLGSLLKHFDNTSEETIANELETASAHMISQRVLELVPKFGRENAVSGAGLGVITDLALAKKTLAEFNDLPKETRDRIIKAEKAYRDFADASLRYMVDKGRMSQEQYNMIKLHNAYYVAFNRLKDVGPGEEIVVFNTKKRGGGAIGIAKKPIKKIKGGSSEIQNPYISVMNNLHDMLKEADRNEIMMAFRKLLVNPRDMHEGEPAPISNIATKGEGPNQIAIFVNGKKELWTFEPDLYRSLKGIVEGSSGGDNIVLRALQLPAKVLRTSIVYFPAFQLRNISRDTFDRMVKSTTGKPFSSFRGKKADWDDIAAYGGLNAGYYAHSPEAYYSLMQESMKKLAKRKDVHILDGDKMKHFFKSYRNFMERGETLNRVAEYRSARNYAIKKLGYDSYNASLYAAFHARDLMDFALMGYQMQWINKYIPFSNAAVQGVRSTVVSAKANPGKFLLRTALYTVVPQVMTWFLNHRNEEVAKRYEEKPSYERDLYWNIDIGDRSFLIPKPYEIGMPAAGIDRLLSKAFWNNDKAFDGYAGQVAESMLPVGDISSLLGPFAGIAQSKANYDFFRQRHIIPPYEEDKPLSDRHTEYASRMGQLLQKAAPWDVDARKIDYMIRNSFGYFGSEALKLSNIGREDSNVKPGINDTGFFRDHPAYNAKSVQEMVDFAHEHGKTSSKEFKQFRAIVTMYFGTKDKKQKDVLASDMIDYARQLMDAWEKESDSKSAGGPPNENVIITKPKRTVVTR